MNEESKPIREAIIKARKIDVIILASASNEGSNTPITFPANIGPPMFSALVLQMQQKLLVISALQPNEWSSIALLERQ